MRRRSTRRSFKRRPIRGRRSYGRRPVRRSGRRRSPGMFGRVGSRM